MQWKLRLPCESKLEQTVCACIGDVIRDLKHEYRATIEGVDLVGQSAEDFAKANGITLNIASVRLHRARKSVDRKFTAVCGACVEHNRLDCSCKGVDCKIMPPHVSEALEETRRNYVLLRQTQTGDKTASP